MSVDPGYVHGYSGREAERLVDQANRLTELLHHDTRYPAGARVLEAGCGVGAQTVTLATGSPGAAIVSIDVSEVSLPGPPSPGSRGPCPPPGAALALTVGADGRTERTPG